MIGLYVFRGDLLAVDGHNNGNKQPSCEHLDVATRIWVRPNMATERVNVGVGVLNGEVGHRGNGFLQPSRWRRGRVPSRPRGSPHLFFFISLSLFFFSSSFWLVYKVAVSIGSSCPGSSEPIYFFSNHLSLSCTSFLFKKNLKNTQAARDGSLRGGATTTLITERTLLGGPHFFFAPPPAHPHPPPFFWGGSNFGF